jgi:N-acetylmuramoyl-L-alanine amidase
MKKFVKGRYFLPILAVILAFTFIICFARTKEASSTPAYKKTIVIDAGHGMPDGGAVSKDGTKEDTLNLKIAKKLEKLLKKSGAKVVMTRTNEKSLSESKTNNKRDDLNKRMEIRNTSNADIFVSIHLNHFSQSQYSGAQVFYNSSFEKSESLASCIQKNLIEIADPSNSRQIKQNNEIYILRNATYPSALVECGFLSNEEETKKLTTDKYQKKLAEAIYKGICEYLKNES